MLPCQCIGGSRQGIGRFLPRFIGVASCVRGSDTLEALLRNRAFAAEYTSARERWRNGIPAVFPAGIYWLQRFASVPVLET
jgi:hypothetical protein